MEIFIRGFKGKGIDKIDFFKNIEIFVLCSIFVSKQYFKFNYDKDFYKLCGMFFQCR